MQDISELSIIEQLKSWWQERRQTHQELAEMRALGSHELAELALDCGVSPARLIDVVRAGHHGADEMEDMMRVLGIDPTTVRQTEPALFADMQVTCATCANKKECKYDIEDGRADKNYLHYCANADVLNELRAMPDMLVDP